MIKVRTIIGYGSPNKRNSYSAHGAALGSDEVKATRDSEAGTPPFEIPEDALSHFRKAVDRVLKLSKNGRQLLMLIKQPILRKLHTDAPLPANFLKVGIKFCRHTSRKIRQIRLEIILENV